MLVIYDDWENKESNKLGSSIEDCYTDLKEEGSIARG